MIELLCVIAVIVGLAAVALPSLHTMLLMPARKTAVDQLMNVFEDARIAALSSGANSYIAFATDADGVPAQDQYREYILFREKTDDDPATAPDYIQISKWQMLPQGVSFKSTIGVFKMTAPSVTYTGIPMPPGSSGSSAPGNLPVVEFTPTGAVSCPATDLEVYLYEGFYNNGQDTFTSANKDYLERLTLSHFTGRVQVDVVQNPSGS